MNTVKIMVTAKNDIDAAKEIYTKNKNEPAIKKMAWLAYGGGREKLNIPVGMPPSEVLGEHWNDSSLEYATRDISIYLTEGPASTVVERAWIKLLKTLSIEEAKILVAATVGDLSAWGLTHELAKEVYGDEKIGDELLIKPVAKQKKKPVKKEVETG